MYVTDVLGRIRTMRSAVPILDLEHDDCSYRVVLDGCVFRLPTTVINHTQSLPRNLDPPSIHLGTLPALLLVGAAQAVVTTDPVEYPHPQGPPACSPD